MGYTLWSSDTYNHLRKSYSTKTRNEIFSSDAMSLDMSPYNLMFRESRDSLAHPESLAVQVYLDVTGSMGRIPEILVTEKLGSLMNTLIEHGIAHPQILFGALGDHTCDRFPLQVGQFESGTNELDQWLTKIYLEGGGGGQHMESYLLAWLFAARHTSTDCFEKRSQKGFVFTIGDEWTWNEITAADITRITGVKETSVITIEQLLQEVLRTNHVFHIHINEGGYRDANMVIHPWKNLLGERFIKLEDHTAVAEAIATAIAVTHGSDLKSITRTFDHKTAAVISKALENVKGDIIRQKKGVIKL